jgi:DNA-binding IclR family transcriptional regulator
MVDDLGVLHFIVLGALRSARRATPDDIAERLDWPLTTVLALLDDLAHGGYVRPVMLH